MSEPLRKLVQLDKLQYHETHLNLVNCLLPMRDNLVNQGKLTPTEIKVLAAFMSLEGDLTRYRFGATAKKVVKESLELSTAGLSNYIHSLLNKGFLIKEGDIINIWSILMPQADEQVYLFKIVNKDYLKTS